MKENNQGKEILKILQVNYEIETAQDLSGTIKDLFKDTLQQMMNEEFDSSMGYSKYSKVSFTNLPPLLNFLKFLHYLTLINNYLIMKVLIFVTHFHK